MKKRWGHCWSDPATVSVFHFLLAIPTSSCIAFGPITGRWVLGEQFHSSCLSGRHGKTRWERGWWWRLSARRTRKADFSPLLVVKGDVEIMGRHLVKLRSRLTLHSFLTLSQFFSSSGEKEALGTGRGGTTERFVTADDVSGSWRN